MPFVVLLEHLARAGWKRASSANDILAMHTLDTPQVMCLSGNPEKDKPYLQCLACLEHILSPSVPSLATRKPAAYYHNILKGQPEPAEERAPLADTARDSSEEEPVAEHPSGFWARPATARSTHKRKLKDTSAINDALLVPLQAFEASRQPSEPGVTLAKAVAPPLQGQSAASSSSAALVQRAEISDDHPANALQGQPGQRRHGVVAPLPREVLATVDGVDIVRDEHLLPGMPGHYVRARVRCPVHCMPGERPCGRTRTFGSSTMKTFGEKEPVAFLASWIRAANEFTDRASHKRYEPGQAALRAAVETLRDTTVEG